MHFGDIRFTFLGTKKKAVETARNPLLCGCLKTIAAFGSACIRLRFSLQALTQAAIFLS